MPATYPQLLVLTALAALATAAGASPRPDLAGLLSRIDRQIGAGLPTIPAELALPSSSSPSSSSSSSSSHAKAKVAATATVTVTVTASALASMSAVARTTSAAVVAKGEFVSEKDVVMLAANARVTSSSSKNAKHHPTNLINKHKHKHSSTSTTNAHKTKVTSSSAPRMATERRAPAPAPQADVAQPIAVDSSAITIPATPEGLVDWSYLPTTVELKEERRMAKRVRRADRWD